MPAAVAQAARYAQLEALLAEHNSQRSIVRATGVSRMTVAKLAKKAAMVVPPLPRRRKKAQQKKWEDLALDEMWSYVGHKKQKVWLWLVVESATRRIMAWVLSCRGIATAQRLWQAPPRRYQRHTRYFTDAWEAYPAILPRAAYVVCAKGSGGTSIVESINCSLRQRCGVLVRKNCSFSKCLKMHSARIKIFIDNHNQSVILD